MKYDKAYTCYSAPEQISQIQSQCSCLLTTAAKHDPSPIHL
uniref:Uncharacterized protein n=1 Tax=Arundo donax TaxID=35708 RepID=A0A0A9AYS7_ARUDO